MPVALQVRVSKLPPGLLQWPQAVALLMATGFRPVLQAADMPPVAIGAAAVEAFLVHSQGEGPLEWVRRAAAVFGEAAKMQQQ